MPLDPIVSLSVALAEAPGTCAFLLGSGVSRDAGVPTGTEVTRRAQRLVYSVEHPGESDAEQEAVSAWLTEQGYDELGYSELLELIAPDQAIRRDYLAGFFEGVEPGPTHVHLADLAVRGLVRVFVTTNFDRLLEHALQARGIEPVVIASDADLEAAVPREHAGAVVIKPHGDYLRLSIPNTPGELDELEPGIDAEIREVFDRYRVVVVGYSGSDPAVGRALRARRARYGVWWVSRGDLGAGARDLVETAGARVVVRESAASFLVDLERRLAAFQEHPSGQTPGVVHDEALRLIRTRDTIGLEELLRSERTAFESSVVAAIDGPEGATLTVGSLRGLWNDLLPVLERRVSGLVPVALYEEERLSREFEQIALALERQREAGGLSRELRHFGATWIGYVLGATLMRLDRVEALRPLMEQSWDDRGLDDQVVWLPGDIGHHLGEALAPSGTRWLSSVWEFITRSLEDREWWSERYPELAGDNAMRRSMAEFDLVYSMWLGAHDRRDVAYFVLGSGSATELARRLHRDARFRTRVAQALEWDDDLTAFTDRAKAALAGISSWMEAGERPAHVVRALATGNAY
jgi:hypothetical protein